MLLKFNQIILLQTNMLSCKPFLNSFAQVGRYHCLRGYSNFLNEIGLSSKLNLIGGNRCEGKGPVVDNLYPATGKVLGAFSESSAEDVDVGVQEAKKAQLTWKEVLPLERGKILRSVAGLIRDEVDSLTQAETLDTGKPQWEAKADIEACADTMEMYAGFAATIQGSHVHLPGNSFYYTRREPLGVCGGIGAWNYPFQMATWKSAPALACGNALVFKPSPLTPLTAVRLGELFTRAGAPPGLMTVVQGGTVTGSAMCNHPGLAKISFTGSVSTGKRVMATSAEHLRPVTLELGGKSPLIIFDDADIEEAVKGAMLANFLSQGQVCSNGTRVFVHKSIVSTFMERLVQVVSRLQVGDPFDANTAVGAMISQNQLDIALDYVKSGLEEGAKVLCGGQRVHFPKDSPLSGGFFMSPCVLADCRDEMRAVREEIFGPVLALLTFEDEEEVLRRANDSPFGLAGGVFTTDLNRAHRVAASLEVGSVYVNNYNVYPPGIPFGGYKHSGFGRENGLETLHYYTQVKAVYVEGGRVDYPFA